MISCSEIWAVPNKHVFYINEIKVFDQSFLLGAAYFLTPYLICFVFKGTSPEEGVGLCFSICEYLLNLKVKFMSGLKVCDGCVKLHLFCNGNKLYLYFKLSSTRHIS